ncbi:MAG: ribosome biogenesis GTP-binding protein YihA/YsxC [Desulfobacteraceae bacterium]|jgi:GTP-binding protein
MHVKSAQFITSAVKIQQYPTADLPEVAFAGRSNVGKSSLINKLVNRKRLVKTSSTPGRTQLINFFQVNGELSLVDLPGYGYAKVPAAVRRQWGPMVEAYIAHRPNLKCVVLLMDLRRTPRDEEFQLLDWLDHHQIPTILVLTKADKLSKMKRSQQCKSAAETLGVEGSDLVLFSAKTGLGKDALWELIERVVGISS